MNCKIVCLLLYWVAFFGASKAQNKYVYPGDKIVTLHMDNVALTAALNAIERQTKITYCDNMQFFKEAKKVSIHVDRVRVEEVLKKLSQDQIFDLHVAYCIAGSIKPALVDKLRTGYVVDDKGNPVSYVTVGCPKIGLADFTTTRGSFYLRNVQPGDTLQVCGYGMKSRIYKVGHEKVIRIPVQKVAMTLEEWEKGKWCEF